MTPISCLLAFLPALVGGHQEPNKKPQASSTQQPRLGPWLRKDRKFLIPMPEGFIEYRRVPDGGSLPAIEQVGERVALLYFKGEDKRGDLFLTLSEDEGKTFGPAQRVNPELGSISVVDGVRPGAVDFGPDGTVHVVWIAKGKAGATLQYARTGEGGELGPVAGLDSPSGLGVASALTVDARGRVYVFHAALGPDGSAPPDETFGVGRIWMQRADPGAEFSAPRAIDFRNGVSLRSGMVAHVDEVVGTVYLLYRSSRPLKKNLMRDAKLLASKDGELFETIQLEAIKRRGDPRTGGALTQDETTSVVAWEGRGHVGWAHVRRRGTVDVSTEPKGGGFGVGRSAPDCVVTSSTILLTWVEEDLRNPEELPIIGWQAWTATEPRPVGRGIAPESPQGSSPVIIQRASADGFTILY
jgi:hypothetical protein